MLLELSEISYPSSKGSEQRALGQGAFVQHGLGCWVKHSFAFIYCLINSMSQHLPLKWQTEEKMR